MSKTMDNVNIADAKQKVPDIKVVGDGDAWKLICKASSESEGWMKSTKAMQIGDAGALVQVTTQQRNLDLTYSLAEALTYVPSALVVPAGEAHALVAPSLFFTATEGVRT